ncbi:hypothetical protein Q8F57_026080 [Paraburkholderia terrae]|uniref:hypothetical protein n=1 Tax=Paraburkholderia terrae TaxID=311230 RepID=UPI00296AFA7E|nr:hypothetical protein [Paraburkholderia terrae]MDW3663254.1 hypothetical protein [Paraburkholderia terrae]
MEVGDVPDDFPRDAMTAVVSGATPKVCVRLVSGVYCANQPDEERLERWLICEDLAVQLVPVARRDAVSNPALSARQTLQRVKAAVQAKNWLPAGELDWLVRRLAALLHW